jgi:hypothetical protein
MDWFLRWGNWGVAKLIEVLFNTNHLSDVGCTYRVLRRPVAEHVARSMTVGGSHAGAEIMLLAITAGVRMVEVPLNYLPRVGVSSVTGNRLVAIRVGLRMLQLILATRRRSPRRRMRPPAFTVARPAAGDEAHEQLPL